MAKEMSKREFEEEVLKGLHGARFGTLTQFMRTMGKRDAKHFRLKYMDGVPKIGNSKLYSVKDFVDANYTRMFG